jgi:hypothetical protein
MRPLKPEHYFRAALERMGQAVGLYHQENSLALAMYVAGLAVECLLRAFKGKRDPTFGEKHDLLRLFKASGLLNMNLDNLRLKGLPEDQAKKYIQDLKVAVNDIHLLWSNIYRFASEQRLRTHLKNQVNLRRGVKGDILKANALRLLNAAKRFIDKGIVLWNLCEKK